MSEGKYEEGLSIFKNITNYEKNNVEVWKKTGITYFVLQQYEKALECFNTVLQLDKKDLHTFYNIGLTYELLYNNCNGDTNKSDTNNIHIKKYYENAALIYYKIALTANPNHFESLVALGIYFYKLGDYHQSKKQLELAINIRSNDWRLLLAMGCVLSDGYNQYKEAKEYFDHFSNSQRKEYVMWINEAKTEETKNKRVATAVEWMSEGKTRHWKYEKK